MRIFNLTTACCLASCLFFQFHIGFAQIDANSFEPMFDFSVVTTGSSSPRVEVIYDLNDDGKPEIITADYQKGKINILSNISGPGLLSAASFSLIELPGPTNAQSIAVGDIDLDGRPDILAGGIFQLSVIRNTTVNHVLSFASKFDLGAGPREIEIRDLNGDTRPEIICTSDGVRIFPNNYDGNSLSASSFGSGVLLNLPNSISFGVEVGDLNGDSKPDIVATYRSPSGQVVDLSLFQNLLSNGASISASGFGARIDINAGEEVRSIKLVDINGDSKLDLAFPGGNHNNLYLIENVHSSGNLSNSSFATPISFPGLNFTAGITSGDLNGDGKQDLVVTSESVQTISIYENQHASGPISTNTLKEKVDFNTGLIICPGISDLDGDGVPDVALTNYTRNAVTIMQGILPPDSDGDGIPDTFDNCPLVSNTNQLDSNNNGIGDVCDPPTISASNIQFSLTYSDRSTIRFTKGNGTHRAVLLRIPSGTAETCTPPSTNNFVNANADYSLNESLYCYKNYQYAVMYADTGTVVHVTGLPNPYFETGSSSGIFDVVVLEFNRVDSVDLPRLDSAAEATLMTSIPPNVYVTNPADQSIGLKTKLNITAKSVSGALTYTIEISPDGDFREQVRSKSGARTLVFDSLAYNTTYYTRVKTNLRPDFGKKTNFTTLAAENLAYVINPMDSAINQKANLNISSNIVPLAQYYTIELNTAPDFTGDSVVQTGGRTQLFSGLRYNTTYYSRVKTEFAENWGVTRQFRTVSSATVNYVATPKDSSVNQNTKLNIAAYTVPNATEYTIQLSESPNFDTVAFEMTGPTRSLTFTGLKYNTRYYNRVRTNVTPDFGYVRSFTTRTAESLTYVISPADNAIDRNTDLKITSNLVPGAMEYTIQLSESSSFDTIAFEMTGPTKTLSFTGLKYNVRYYNRVKTDLAPNFGMVKSFVTRTPESLAYVTNPAQGSIDRPTTLKITSNIVPGASLYTIQLSETEDFDTVAFQMTSPLRYMTFTGLQPGTTYYNRVRTDLSSAYGIVKDFTTLGSAGARIGSENHNELTETQSEQLDVTVYPNPFREKVTIQVKSRASEVNISIIDLTGKVHYQSAHRTHEAIDVTEKMPAGLYLLKVQERGVSKMMKILKTH